MKTQTLALTLLSGSVISFWSPCFGAGKPASALTEMPETLSVPIPATVLSKIKKIRVGSTRGTLEKTLPKGWMAHPSGYTQWIYLIPGPDDFQKKHPGYYVGLLVTLGHTYLPSEPLYPSGSRRDKRVDNAYKQVKRIHDAAEITAIDKPYITRLTGANSGPVMIY